MTHFKVTVSLWDYKVFSKLKIFESKGVSKLSQIKIHILQGLLKAFPHSDILRNDKTIFQYNFLYSLFSTYCLPKLSCSLSHFSSHSPIKSNDCQEKCNISKLLLILSKLIHFRATPLSLCCGQATVGTILYAYLSLKQHKTYKTGG